MRKRVIISALALLTVLSGCSVSSRREKYVDASDNVTEQTITVRPNIEVDEEGLFKVYKYLEDNTYYIFTRSRLGLSIKKAYQVLKDTTRKVIDNVNNFLLDENIASIELELEPGVPVEGVKLSSRTFTGIYLDNPIKTKINYAVLPADASNQNVKFFSSNTEVLTVDGRGNITIKKAGTATVTIITLEGGFKEMCFFKIARGDNHLKNSIGFDDYEPSDLIENRYDETSLQESSLNAVTKTPTGDIIVAAGTRTKRLNEYVGIVYYHIPNPNNPSNGSVAEIDATNKIFSESLAAITYNESDHRFYTVGYALESSNSRHKGLIANLQIVQTGIGEKIEVIEYKTFGTPGEYFTQFTSVLSVGNYIYVAGREFDDPALGFHKEGARFSRSYIYQFDDELNIVERTRIPELQRISKIRYNEDADVIYFGGEDEKGAGIMGEFFYNTTKDARLGYTTMTDNIKINDIVQIAPDSYAVVGQTYVRGVTTGNLQTFSLNSDGNHFNNNGSALVLHDDAYTFSSYNSLIYSGGVITVLGYAELKHRGIRKWWNPSDWFKKSEKYGYGMAVNFDISLKYISGFKYFNGQRGKGKIQMFNDAVVMTGGEITAVGRSNYQSRENDEKQLRIYVQYNVSLLGIQVKAEYPANFE